MAPSVAESSGDSGHCGLLHGNSSHPKVFGDASHPDVFGYAG